ncbi:hypothetical protein BHE74_00019885 [Ensete ventricosum]|nr:hypothetical protein BHE74_00019885 [Ensete ventricosum]
MGWANVYKRRVAVFTTALLIYLDYKVLCAAGFMIDNWYSGCRRDEFWEATHERNAKRVLDLMIQLEGLWVKLGQYLSTRADALPDAYVRLLKQLQDSLPPRPLKEVTEGIKTGPAVNNHWIYDSPVHSDLEGKLRQLLIELGSEKILGIQVGVESRLATLAVDTEDLQTLIEIEARQELAPPSSQQGNVAETMSSLPVLFNNLNTRRAIIPAANAHCSARALARFYAALANGGSTLPPHSLLSKPPLGSHVHTPTFPPLKRPKKKWRVKRTQNKNSSLTDISIDDGGRKNTSTIFSSPTIHDAFMGVGDYSGMAIPNGRFGLGFRRFTTTTGDLRSFGHAGVGGSTAVCDTEHNFSIAVTVNKMGLGGVTGRILQLVCSELNIDLNLPLPEEFSRFG